MTQALRPLLNGTRTLLLCDKLEIRFSEAEQARRDSLGDRVVRRVVSQGQVDMAARAAVGAIGGGRGGVQ